MKCLTIAVVAASCLSLVAGSCRAADQSPFPIAWEVTDGVQSPESAYWDAASGFVFVSNIGQGGPTGKDGDGYLSKLSPDGKVIAAQWVTGLNAPKGIRSSGNRLWVSDIDQLIGVDIAEGKIVERIPVPGAEFLNDVACDDQGAVYVSDMNKNKIHRYHDGQLSVLAEGEILENPNGLLVVGKRLVVGGWGSTSDGKTTLGRLFALDLESGQKSLITPEPVGNLDGVEAVAQDRYLASDWSAGKVFYIRPGGTVTLILQLPKGSADLGYVPDQQLLLVPQMLENKITAYQLRRPESAEQPGR